MKKRRHTLIEQLQLLLEKAKTQDVSVQIMLDTLAGKGQAALLVLLSIPFCQPIQIPGFSTPFGIMLALIGLRIAFGHRSWLPQSILQKKIPYNILKNITTYSIKIIKKLRFFISTRWLCLVQNPTLHILHGITIALLALLLALPLPIPLTNVLAAIPILLFGLAILEDDGLLIIIAYALALIAFSTFFALVFFGKEGIAHLYKILF